MSNRHSATLVNRPARPRDATVGLAGKGYRHRKVEKGDSAGILGGSRWIDIGRKEGRPSLLKLIVWANGELFGTKLPLPKVDELGQRRATSLLPANALEARTTCRKATALAVQSGARRPWVPT